MSKYVDKLPVVKSLKVELKVTIDRFKPYLKTKQCLQDQNF